MHKLRAARLGYRSTQLCNQVRWAARGISSARPIWPISVITLHATGNDHIFIAVLAAADFESIGRSAARGIFSAPAREGGCFGAIGLIDALPPLASSRTILNTFLAMFMAIRKLCRS